MGDVEETLHFAELGVVFLLFLIGLELEPARLWRMRVGVFGLLLGLFFIAVGMSANLGVLSARPGDVLGLVIGLTAVKLVVLIGIGRAAKLPRSAAVSLGV